MKQRLAFSIVFLFVLFLFGFSKAEACSCVPSNSPCAVYQSADAVFLATAEEITKSENLYGSKTKLKVEEAFKGVNSPQEIILNEGVCEFNFEVGETYLVYATRDKKTNFLRVFLCSRTTSLKNAVQDLEFIRLLVAGKLVSSIYGIVKQPANNEKHEFIPLPNVRLVMFTDFLKSGDKNVRSKKTNSERETVSDSKGNYRFDNLPEGMHRLRIFLPNDLTTFNDERKIFTQNPSCSESSFDIHIDGRISGKIVNAEGKPAPLVGVSISNRENQYFYYLPNAQTDINGNYEIKGIPPGKYILSVSPSRVKSNFSFPFISYYYPATFNAFEAKIIELDYAGKVQGINLKMLPTSFEKKIQIELVWEDEMPISPPNIYYNVFAGTAETSSNYVYTDKQGKGTLTIFSGFDYQIYAYGQSKDGRVYETDKVIVKAENTEDVIKLKVRLRR